MKSDVREGQLPRGAGTAGDVAIVPAASVLVLRDHPLEVLMIRRHKRSSFVPDAWVFPGGAVDTSDAALGDGSELATMRVAAARELFEETGIWPGAPLAQSEERRNELLAGRTSFASLVEQAPIDLGRFVWTSRWITPAGVPKRFDTYFFLTEAGRDVVATAENSEAVEVIWISPAEALRREGDGNFPMVFPTIKHLEAITSFDSVAALLESRRDADIPTTRPILEDDHGRKRIVLP
ncbi:MAG: NUDIX hydrolase [Thermoanaerobaculia bacterium]